MIQKYQKQREIVTKVKKVQELTECWFSDSKDILSSQGPSYESLNTHCFNAIELDDIETLTALVYYFKNKRTYGTVSHEIFMPRN